MNRFFAIDKSDKHLIFNEKTHKHFKVLRLQNKKIIGVYDQKFYECVVEGNLGLIISQIDENHEYNFDVVLAASVIKIDRFEWMLEKATEMGVTRIIPVVSQHCDSEIVKYKFNKKIDRFKEILLNAAEQSFRNKVPTLSELTPFEEVLKIDANFKIMAHEKSTININSLQQINDNVLFLVGPEGGFSDKEVSKALENNFEVVLLGKRILRAESASIYLLAQLKD
ncbi:16S rRNA (uracil(1498)-N(3))-methyltransferase [Mycoplasmopsis ciconiae]|uniref:Ribosomal RNA small subunit methyltransferase E n=1 Tax=Mycoplasmopsis ciconiae TaxID=561067 RepID=A0ABU7MM53_9BACT|nr:16S rRNA (uracil(1498)-N(3))-methyltransferase [Mycoplasmopsis ciconiae]